MLIGSLAGILAAAFFGVAAVVQAHAIRSFETRTAGLRTFVRSALGSPLMLLVVAAYLAGFVLHAVAIWLLPLYLAQAAVALSLPLTALAAIRVGERANAWQWAAVGSVVAGLILLSLGAGTAGSVRASAGFALGLWVGILLITVTVSLGALSHGVAYGVLSGLAYAGSAIAVRGVAWPLTAPTLIAAASVGVYGLLGFWLYSTGLDRAPVSSVSAPLIVGQTAIPGVVGLAFLGDGIRDGWGSAIVVGLLLAMAGADLVNRAHSDPERESVTGPES
jgi:drug/metabolite transporter (DMT)-like permease